MTINNREKVEKLARTAAEGLVGLACAFGGEGLKGGKGEEWGVGEERVSVEVLQRAVDRVLGSLNGGEYKRFVVIFFFFFFFFSFSFSLNSSFQKKRRNPRYLWHSFVNNHTTTNQNPRIRSFPQPPSFILPPQRRPLLL